MMTDDVRHRKTRKIKQKRGKTRTLKVGGYTGKEAEKKAREAITAGPIADNLTRVNATQIVRDNVAEKIKNALIRYDHQGTRMNENERKGKLVEEVGQVMGETEGNPNLTEGAAEELQRLIGLDRENNQRVAKESAATAQAERQKQEMAAQAERQKQAAAAQAKRQKQAAAAQAERQKQAADVVPGRPSDNQMTGRSGGPVLSGQQTRAEAAEKTRLRQEQILQVQNEKRREKDHKKQEKKKESAEKNFNREVNARMNSAVKEHVTGSIMDWSKFDGLIRGNNSASADYSAGIDYIRSSVIPSMPTVLSAYDFVTSSEPATEERYKAYVDIQNRISETQKHVDSSQEWKNIRDKVEMQVESEESESSRTSRTAPTTPELGEKSTKGFGQYSPSAPSKDVVTGKDGAPGSASNKVDDEELRDKLDKLTPPSAVSECRNKDGNEPITHQPLSSYELENLRILPSGNCATKDNILEAWRKSGRGAFDPTTNNPMSGGAPGDSTVVTVLPSPLLREKSGVITDLVLNGTLAQLYPMDPFFRPNSGQCPVSILVNNTVDPSMFAKGYGNKILQPGGALTTLDFLNSSEFFTKRVNELSDNQSLCYNLFFQQTNVPKNVAYMLMCIANNGFERPGPTTEPIVDIEKLQKFWNPVSLEWQYREIKTGKILTLAGIESHNATLIDRGAKPGAVGLYDVRYIGTRNDCSLDAIVSMAAGARAPILPIYCWTNGKTGFFDSQRFPDNIMACELFKQVQSKLGGEGKIFNDSIMNNIIRILPAQYNNKCTFEEVDDVALSVPGLEVKIAEEIGEALREYWSSPATKRPEAAITKQWQIDGRLFQRVKLVKAIILFNSKQGEYSTQMMTLNKVPFLVPVTPDVTNLESVRSYYADFFANIPANALENPIMPVYGYVSYLNASNLGQQINSPGYGSGSSMMLWLMLALTLFPEHPNRLNELIQLDKLAPDDTVNFTVTGLEDELDSPEIIRNFTVIVLQAICRELFSRAFEPSSSEPIPPDTGATMNEITEARNMASDKRDASRSFYEKMAGSNKYTPEQAAKKREALVKINQYLLGSNLRVCRNENAIAGESQKSDIGLKWVQPVTRTEQDNFIQEKPYFSIFSKQRTEAQKQVDLKKLEDRQDGFFQSGVACIFNNDAVDYPLSEYTIACGTRTDKCAPLTPSTNFAFILANLQTAYIKMKFRATLLDKPDKQEFVNDLGNYGLRYILTTIQVLC